ncbi:hypothetical protein WA1_50705 [Scytonema hofmannii PCC 7110]|uniref:Uncharacterized protein n=1 Tax=Scytonema hofmannii PCC 7110 TaxID=128403 RepID=A0A139WPZ3_9CYAN|nr:hypothetical protein [Scytonema hofmannii]KYC34502.1 hypothetical protein WA1_50705 [Scytonema hofmannii PCC 7110]
MSTFESLKKELEELRNQGHCTHPLVESMVEQYSQKVDEADRLFRQKQAFEASQRNSQNPASHQNLTVYI